MGSTNELALAAEINARAEGKKDTAKLIHQIFKISPESDKKIMELLNLDQSKSSIQKYSSNEALALLLHLDLSKDDYLYLRSGMVAKNIPDMHPSYPKLQEAADQAMPDPTAISVTETHAEVKLHALLDRPKA